jgi:hypothetical protein
MGSTRIHNGTLVCTVEIPDMGEVDFLAVLSMDGAEADMGKPKASWRCFKHSCLFGDGRAKDRHPGISLIHLPL